MSAFRVCRVVRPRALVPAVVCVLWLASASNVTALDSDELDNALRQHVAALVPLATPGLGVDAGRLANDVVAIKEGADLDLSCPIVVKNEDMVISWTCDNEPANIRSSRIHVTDAGKLRIHSSKVGDSCNYRCEAADGHGALSVIIRVIIVDQRLMEELSRRAASQTARRHEEASVRTVNESNALELTGASQFTRKRLIGGAPSASSLLHAKREPAAIAPGASERRIEMARNQELGSEIEMQIEPSQVSVERNRTFSLECRIKHAPHLAAPQIIWLKEFMGPPLASANDALDKNLIYLDGVHYHSLNWPRAITYSNKSSTASSALLIRHPSYVHSGRYACFAAYPAFVMTLDQSANSLLATQAAVGGGADHSLGLDTANSPASRRQNHLRYKLAQAWVHVDDKEGEQRYRQSLGSLDSRAGASRDSFGRPARVLMDVVVTNSWQRNLTIALLVLCSSLMLIKLILVASRRARAKSPPQHVAMLDDADADAGSAQSVSANPHLLVQSAPVPPDQGRWPKTGSGRPRSDSHLLGSHLPDVFQCFGEVPANSLIEGGGALREAHRIDQQLLRERLNEHVYSEIGGSMTVPKTVEPYYKRPNKNNI